jgi:predicted NAD/FAD-dependent oxidoreductase
MTEKIHDTIIIGAGIAGLACARKLHENGREFLVISEDIGGRILTSEDGKVNYGAYFTADNFHNFNKFAIKRKRMNLSKFCFHEDNCCYRIWDKRFFCISCNH